MTDISDAVTHACVQRLRSISFERAKAELRHLRLAAMGVKGKAVLPPLAEIGSVRCNCVIQSHGSSRFYFYLDGKFLKTIQEAYNSVKAELGKEDVTKTD